MTLSKTSIDAENHSFETYDFDSNKATAAMNNKPNIGLHFYLVSKRLIDIIGSLLGLIITVPIFIIISIFYLFGSQRGPVFFKQKRIGQYGKPFYIYKFRSMVVNAEDRLKLNEKLYRKYVENSFKLKPEEDPRITKIGLFLRRTSLDELPQFLNVLKGEMSLIGPRPVVQEELTNYGELKNLFLSVKPGITGYWQAYGRSNIDYPKRADTELHYILNRSFTFDMKILFVTIYSVLLRRGAY